MQKGFDKSYFFSLNSLNCQYHLGKYGQPLKGLAALCYNNLSKKILTL